MVIYLTRCAGSGVFAEVFAARGLAVTGIDINPEMIAVAQHFASTGDFQIAGIENLPCSDNSFNLVFLGHILHEVENAVQALSEVRRVARKSVAVLEWPYRQEEIGPPIAHRITPEQITTLAKQAGFQRYEEVNLSHMALYRLAKDFLSKQ